MLSLFFPSNSPVPIEGLRHQSTLDNPLSLYRRDVERVIDYYRRSTRYVSSNHILARALSLMLGSLQLAPEDYYDIAVQKAYPISKHLQFTSSVQVGEVSNGRFYLGSREIIISVISYLNPFRTDWEDWRPVTVKYHTRNHLDYNLPLLTQTAPCNDLVVLEVDLPMLSLQYYHYYKSKLAVGNDKLLGFGYFIGKYVLPNMLYSQADRQLINRIKYLFYTQQEIKSPFKQPIFTTDYSTPIDRELIKLIGLLSHTGKGYETLLQELPGVFEPSTTAFSLTNSAPTRQIKWAWWLARKEDIAFLKDFFGRNAIRRNGTYWSEFAVFKKELEQSNVLSTIQL